MAINTDKRSLIPVFVMLGFSALLIAALFIKVYRGIYIFINRYIEL